MKNFNINDLQNEIIKLKKETDTVILAHIYQSHEIIEIADFVGDSYGLSVDSKNTKEKNILFCGVNFMAETAKIINPDKNVFIANRNAGCPMAEEFTPNDIIKLKEQHKDAAVVCYINTSAELKAECDVCVTSASAVNIVKKLPQKEIVFIPDPNLGAFVEKNVPEKKFIFINGGCPYHAEISADDVHAARNKYPNAKLLTHPECKKEVTELSDYVGSTTGIMKYAEESPDTEFIIGTELSITEHLSYNFRGKNFYPLSKKLICPEMRLTSLVDVYKTLLGIKDKTATDFKMTDVFNKAKKCIDKMIELG